MTLMHDVRVSFLRHTSVLMSFSAKRFGDNVVNRNRTDHALTFNVDISALC